LTQSKKIEKRAAKEAGPNVIAYLCKRKMLLAEGLRRRTKNKKGVHTLKDLRVDLTREFDYYLRSKKSAHLIYFTAGVLAALSCHHSIGVKQIDHIISSRKGERERALLIKSTSEFKKLSLKSWLEHDLIEKFKSLSIAEKAITIANVVKPAKAKRQRPPKRPPEKDPETEPGMDVEAESTESSSKKRKNIPTFRKEHILNIDGRSMTLIISNKSGVSQTLSLEENLNIVIPHIEWAVNNVAAFCPKVVLAWWKAKGQEGWRPPSIQFSPEYVTVDVARALRTGG